MRRMISYPMRIGRLATVWFCGLAAGMLAAQSVSWEPTGGTLAKGQVSTLSLVFENCEPKGEAVALPQTHGLDFGKPGVSRSSTFSFGGSAGERRTGRVVLSYPVRLSTENPVTIPSFKVETDAGEMVVPSVSFDVGEAAVARGVALSEVTHAQLTLPQREVWTGEVFRVAYQLALQRRLQPRLAGAPEWAGAPLVAEAWPEQPAVGEVSRDGQENVVITYETQASSGQSGEVTVNPVRQRVALATGRDLYGRPVYNQFFVATEAATMTVKPLPLAPEGFGGAVGKFSLQNKVVPEQVTVGEPITWTLELSGKGNWPMVSALPARRVSQDFEAVQPRAKKTMEEGKMFEGRLAEDVVLIPTKPGRYTLGPAEVVVFDPEQGAYVTLTTKPVEVEVLAGAARGTNGENGAEGTMPGFGGQGKIALPKNTPELPEAIPNDPLVAASEGEIPLPAADLFWRAAACALWPLLLWLGLAWRRARQTDPLRPRREAHRRLGLLLRRMGAALASGESEGEIRADLLRWQRETALLWRLKGRMPTAAQLPDAVWAVLWSETERVLYREETRLPEEWVRQAEEAWRNVRFPRQNPFRALAPRNLLPFFALVLLGVFDVGKIWAAEEVGAAQTPEQAYATGDFATAEKGWREAMDAHPMDWGTRHNLSLALAQQERWEESAAVAVTALVQQPQSTAVRRQARLALGKAGYAPERLGDLLEGKPTVAWVASRAPREWQNFLWQSGVIFAAGWAVVLLALYGGWGKWWSRLGAVVSLLALLNGAASLIALRVYGDWLQPSAAVVARAGTLYSVPTEAEVEQETAQVAAGTLVLVGKYYLGWRKISFADGQTGWVRAEFLEPVWKK